MAARRKPSPSGPQCRMSFWNMGKMPSTPPNSTATKSTDRAPKMALSFHTNPKPFSTLSFSGSTRGLGGWRSSTRPGSNNKNSTGPATTKVRAPATPNWCSNHPPRMGPTMAPVW